MTGREPHADPAPFQAEQPGEVRWQYLERGPAVWRVRIGRLPDLAATPILDLVACDPELRSVLDSFGLDTCCGGDLSVTEAAAQHNLALEPVLEAINRVWPRAEDYANGWVQMAGRGVA